MYKKSNKAHFGYMKKGLERLISPTLKDIYWLAGFYDGEGCCYATRRNEHSRCIRFTISQKDPEKLHWCKARFGGSIHYAKCTDSYFWDATGPRARGLVMTIYPLVSHRRQGQIR